MAKIGADSELLNNSEFRHVQRSMGEVRADYRSAIGEIGPPSRHASRGDLDDAADQLYKGATEMTNELLTALTDLSMGDGDGVVALRNLVMNSEEDRTAALNDSTRH